jgi:hypothetical protein
MIGGAALLIALQATQNVPNLVVRQDAASPGTVLVEAPPSVSSSPLLVSWYPRGRKAAVYRSPSSDGFDLCGFLRGVHAEKTKGPLRVAVRRGSLRTDIELLYDGRSCRDGEPPSPAAITLRRPPRPMRTHTPKSARTLTPMQITEVGSVAAGAAPAAAPCPSAPECVEYRLAEARLGRAEVSLIGTRLVFVVEFDRAVRLEPNARAVLTRLHRVDPDQRILPAAAGFSVTKDTASRVRWILGASFLPVDPPLRDGEVLDVSLTLDGVEFAGIPMTVKRS